MQKRDFPFGRPWITDDDREAVMKVLQGHILTHGPNCKAFEEGYAAMMGGGSCTTTSSCMGALHLASYHIGFGPGDEVVVPAQSHVATVHAVELTGARPVFVDCDPATGNMTPEGIADAITDRTKAISVVHYAGIPVSMTEVMAIADAKDLPVIEDCALAIGSRYDGTHVGLFGIGGCYSFYPVKHITTGEGGMFVSKDSETIKAVASFRGFSYDRTLQERKIPGIYDVSNVGLNYRMSEMQAALGCAQLTKIPEILKRRAVNFGALKARLIALPGVSVVDAVDPKALNSHYCLVATFDGAAGRYRDDLILTLNEHGVGTSVYYPHPIPRLKYYRDKYGYDASLFQGAETISDRGIAFPVGPHLTTEDMDAIADILTEVLETPPFRG